MKNSRLLLPVVALIVAALVAVIASTTSGKNKPQPAVAPGSAISLRQTSLGRALTDASGRTLYLFAGDRANASTLSAAGRAVWPPFVTPAKPHAGSGVLPAQIGTIAGSQVTYNGHPLYYYVGDKQAGQTLGQDLNQFGARWYVLSGAGAAITAAPRSVAPSSSSGGSYGSGY